METIEQGLPPLDFLPASEEMFIRGKRHMIAAPWKAGKSITTLVHIVDMVLDGARVMIFDRENGAQLYAMRLKDIIDSRGLAAEQLKRLRDDLDYHEFPRLKRGDQEQLIEYCESADLVVYDSQRMFLSSLGLKESVSDDYAEFMDVLIDPLFRANVATLLLDNTGFQNQTRSRGTSSKEDLNELLFSLKTEKDFDLYRTGLAKLKIEHSRFGTTGEWTMTIGGGMYEPWRGGGPAKARPDFMKAMLEVLKEKEPLGMDKLINAVRQRGVKIRTDQARDLLNGYVEDGDCPVIHTADGYARRPTPGGRGVASTPRVKGVGGRG